MEFRVCDGEFYCQSYILLMINFAKNAFHFACVPYDILFNYVCSFAALEKQNIGGSSMYRRQIHLVTSILEFASYSCTFFSYFSYTFCYAFFYFSSSRVFNFFQNSHKVFNLETYFFQENLLTDWSYCRFTEYVKFHQLILFFISFFFFLQRQAV